MSKRILIATRKGLFIGSIQNKWQIDHLHFAGDPVSFATQDSRNHWLYAALNLGHFGVKLQRSTDDGKTWKTCAVPQYPPKPKSGPAANDPTPWSNKLLWCIQAGGADQEGLLWAGTIPGGLFKTEDHGDHWQLVQSLWDKPERQEWLGGGYEHPGIHSICVHPDNSAHITIGISAGGVWTSMDSGEHWQLSGPGMRAAYMPPKRAADPVIQDPHRLVQCQTQPEVFWVQHHNGIFRSTDTASSWEEIKTAHPSSFGFATVVHPKNPDLAWFVPAVKDECRIPVDGKLVVSRTSDGGKSFDELSQGLPQSHCYDLVYRHGLDIDAEGNCLVMGSTTGGLWFSNDQGENWLNLSHSLPPIYSVKFI